MHTRQAATEARPHQRVHCNLATVTAGQRNLCLGAAEGHHNTGLPQDWTRTCKPQGTAVTFSVFGGGLLQKKEEVVTSQLIKCEDSQKMVLIQHGKFRGSRVYMVFT